MKTFYQPVHLLTHHGKLPVPLLRLFPKLRLHLPADLNPCPDHFFIQLLSGLFPFLLKLLSGFFPLFLELGFCFCPFLLKLFFYFRFFCLQSCFQLVLLFLKRSLKVRFFLFQLLLQGLQLLLMLLFHLPQLAPRLIPHLLGSGLIHGIQLLHFLKDIFLLKTEQTAFQFHVLQEITDLRIIHGSYARYHLRNLQRRVFCRILLLFFLHLHASSSPCLSAAPGRPCFLHHTL